jgi:hypothetical protein
MHSFKLIRTNFNMRNNISTVLFGYWYVFF